MPHDTANSSAARERLDRIADMPAPLALIARTILALFAVCRSRAALAMMSERDLSDVGLLPWEVQSEIDGGADDRAAIRRFRTLAPCNQA